MIENKHDFWISRESLGGEFWYIFISSSDKQLNAYTYYIVLVFFSSRTAISFYFFLSVLRHKELERKVWTTDEVRDDVGYKDALYAMYFLKKYFHLFKV